MLTLTPCVDLRASSLSHVRDGGWRGKAAFPDRSHLSPDGGGFTRAVIHRLAADGYDLAADGYKSGSPPILFVRNPRANRPNHRENRYNPEDWQHFL